MCVGGLAHAPDNIVFGPAESPCRNEGGLAVANRCWPVTSTKRNEGKEQTFLVNGLPVDPQAMASAISEVERFDGLVD